VQTTAIFTVSAKKNNMQILHIIPGSGGSFYCGNCLRDSKYVDAMRSLGHEVIKVPMYLPLFADEHDLKDIPVFYGAVAIYLKQIWPAFRSAPAWVDRMLNSKPVLKIASGFAGSTRAKGLEEMTVSMLLGEDGQQSAELEKMIDWIADHCQPDVIHLSNALLLGLAPRFKEKLNVPVVCSLQDEDVWVDPMKKKFREQVWKLMQTKAKSVDHFISVSDYYLELMQEKLNLHGGRISRIHLGVDPEDYEFSSSDTKPLNIGFLSRMCHENGLDILIDAFVLLKRATAFKECKLILSGGYTADDKKYLKRIRKKLKRYKLTSEVEFHEDFEGPGRLEFFKKVSLLSVPVRNGEAFGLYLLESMASGIPVVQPKLGAFPEVVELSKGGSIYFPNEAGKLAKALASLLHEKRQLKELSIGGRKGVRQFFDIRQHASEIIDLYHSVQKKKIDIKIK